MYRSKKYPCFGAQHGLTCTEWWYETMLNTYMNTENLNPDIKDEMKDIFPEVFRMLYNDVYSTQEGWQAKEDIHYVLTKLAEWRDKNHGPKLGIISNFDDRLSTILEGQLNLSFLTLFDTHIAYCMMIELDLLKYFDFVLTSYESSSEKPQRDMFDMALQQIGMSSPEGAYHIGDSIAHDIAGAQAAGWSKFLYYENFDESFIDWDDVATPENTEQKCVEARQMLEWGRKDVSNGLEWVELWGIDDLLTVFGFPDDLKRPIRITKLKGIQEEL